jgi:predicted dehydrogenase
VHSWQGNRGNGFTKLTEPPAPAPVPETVDWDKWLGVASFREFAADVYHPFKWRDWQDFGGGTMGDFGCHILDPIFTALGIKDPLTIRADNEGLNPQTWPGSETVSYVFAGTPRTAGKTLAVTWYDGGRQPDAALFPTLPADKKIPKAGSLVLGEAGTLIIPHVAPPELYLRDSAAAPVIEKVPGSSHYHAWVDAALGGSKTTDGFDYAGPLTEAVQLGNVATRFPGETLVWDAKALKIKNVKEANKLLTRTYREGWKIKAVS